MIEIRVPSPGESIKQVQLANWLVEDGSLVEKDQDIAEIDSDKATLAVASPEAGRIKIKVPAGETVDVGSVICTIDIAVMVDAKPANPPAVKPEAVVEPAQYKPETTQQQKQDAGSLPKEWHISPLARKMIQESGLKEEELKESIMHLRISRNDVKAFVAIKDSKGSVSNQLINSPTFSRDYERKKMSQLRLKLSERLVAVKNQTAMLTTFNEVNMSSILAIKKKYNDQFKEKYGYGIGFMSFFTKAATMALQEFPAVNSQIEGDEVVIPQFVDVGIAVSAPKGLVVPVIRNTESMSIPEIEGRIKELAAKARNNKLTLEEMSGGTFTITNGGVFGSMMSTPILNPPQSGILGMHNIMERPVALNGKIEIQPMMYLALSYDHRVIDGRESVSFIVRVKELIEDPLRMLFSGKDAPSTLLGLI